MLKNKLKKRIFLIISSLLIILIIYLFPTKKIETINNEKKSYKNAYIYLIDYNNYVARVNVVLKENDRINKIKEIINYLTIDGNIKVIILKKDLNKLYLKILNYYQSILITILLNLTFLKNY